MKKHILIAFAFAGALTGSAFAADWNVTEEGASGIKSAQGVWAVTTEGGKVTGTATMQLQNGNPLSYKLDGTVQGDTYTVNLVDRTDDKKGCVWVGKTPATGKGIVGEAQCQGTKLTIRASH